MASSVGERMEPPRWTIITPSQFEWERRGLDFIKIGLPDYDAYVAHVRAQHPDETPMTREQFAVERMQARYAKGRSRCC